MRKFLFLEANKGGIYIKLDRFSSSKPTIDATRKSLLMQEHQTL